MSAIIQETGGPLKEERAVDGKLKSRLEWPNLWVAEPVHSDTLLSRLLTAASKLARE